MHRAEKLGSDNILKLLAKFAMPAIFSLVLHALYNIVDRIFIGQGVGQLGLSGVALCFPIFLLLFGVCLLFSSGGSALISLYIGEQKKDKAEKVLGNVFTLITISGIIITFLGVFYIDNILCLFKVNSVSLPYAKNYILILFSGSLLFLYGFALTFIIRAEGNPFYSTLMMIVATIINVILDAIFIFKFSMGTGGAALATVIAEGVVVAMGLFYVFRKKGLLHVRWKNLYLDKVIVKKILLLGMSPAIMDIVASLQLSILNQKLNYYGGAIAVAVMGVIFAIASLMMLFTFGMAAGMQPIVGYNYGAKKIVRAKKTFVYSCVITFLISVVFVVVLFIFSHKLVGLFSKNDKEFIILGSRALTIFFVTIPLSNLIILAGRYFQAIGKGVHSLAIGLIKQLFIFIPILYLLSRQFQLEGIWASGPVTDSLAFIVAGVFILFEFRSIKKFEVDFCEKV